jgi:hypothetical protein
MAEHVGYDKHAPEGRNRGTSRNGTRLLESDTIDRLQTVQAHRPVAG